MAVYEKDPYENLAALNAMVSFAMGGDPQQADQIQAAIRFCRQQAERAGEQQSQHARETARAYNDIVENLVRLHIEQDDDFGFSHWDLGAHPYDPLWIRAHLVRELKKISGFPRALLLVTGLRQALCPPRKYWTQKRAERYREAISYIENLAMQFKTPRTRLSLLFV